MGLFSKNKKEEKTSGLPPMPPSLPSAPASAPSMPSPSQTPSNQGYMENVGELKSPKIPGIDDSFSDIKSQVISSSPDKTQVEPEISTDLTEPSKLDSSDSDSSSDSLFDLSGIEIPNLEDIGSEDNEESATQIDANIEPEENLNFVSRSHSKSKVEENIFVTTSQFKALLEIVESVKSRIKDSSEIHLKLLDIKSEEDIEYENLRKSFQFIEDKLYEVDSLIFEK